MLKKSGCPGCTKDRLNQNLLGWDPGNSVFKSTSNDYNTSTRVRTIVVVDMSLFFIVNVAGFMRR